MDTADKNLTANDDTLKPDDALPPLVAYQVEQESLENAPASSGVAGERYRHGRLEAETRRVSDEVTREAQQRRRATLAAAQAITQADAETPAKPIVKPTFPPGAAPPTPTLMRRFFVPLDGTLLGERALPYASALAQLLHAQVLLGHITPTEPPALLGQVFGIEDTRRQVTLQAFAPEALPYLRQLRDQMATNSFRVDTLHTTAPSVAEGLLQLEQSRDIDLVFAALGYHSETDRMKVGRVVDALIRSGTAPVFAVPPEADAGVRPFALRHILVTLDGSTLAEQALAPLLGLLRRLPEHPEHTTLVTLLAVAEDYSILPDYQSYLDALHGRLATMQNMAGVHFNTRAIVGSPPGAIVGAIEHGINHEADGEAVVTPQVDLLIMTTHGRGGLGRWLFGSVAHYVLPRIRIPVLLTRPDPSTL